MCALAAQLAGTGQARGTSVKQLRVKEESWNRTGGVGSHFVCKHDMGEEQHSCASITNASITQ